MKVSDFKDSPKGEVLEYVVFEEHTLGYLFKSDSGLLMLGVIRGSGLKGGLDWMNGPQYHVDYKIDRLRKATEEDFKTFRVSSRGYIK